LFPKPLLPKAIAKLSKGPGSSTSSPIDTLRLSSIGPLNEGIKGLELRISDIDPLEIARQLCLIEFDLFSRIHPREFVGLSWMKDDKEIRAPNIIKMVRWSNHVVNWIVTEIVSIKDSQKTRVAMVERVIAIAKVYITNFSI
jgi:hypothetical protein